MRQDRSPILSHLCLLCSLFLIISKARSTTQDTVANDGASKNARNDTISSLRINTTSNGLDILTEGALNATGREPDCDVGGIPGLTVASCEDAIAQIPDTQASLQDPFGQPLQIPMRYSSCK